MVMEGLATNYGLDHSSSETKIIFVVTVDGNLVIFVKSKFIYFFTISQNITKYLL